MKKRRDAMVQTTIDLALLAEALSSTPPRRPTTIHHLPDELLGRCFSMLGEYSVSAFDRATNGSYDPARWWDETVIVSDTLERERTLRPLRLVSRTWLHVSLPVYFDRISLIPPRSCVKPPWPLTACNSAEHIVDAERFLFLLRSRPPPRRKGDDGTNEAPNGHYIRRITLGHANIHLKILRSCMERMDNLMPNVRAISGLHLRAVPLSDLLSLKLPRLQTFSELFISGSHKNHSGSSGARETQNDVLHVLNAFPEIKSFSVRGASFTPSAAQRFLAILSTNWVMQAGRLGPQRPAGLTRLVFESACLVDLSLLDALPKVTPALEELVVGDCAIVDQTDALTHFNLLHLVSKLDRLVRFEFIGTKQLPSLESDGSTAWASCDSILEVGPRIRHLHIRIDLVTKAFFFNLDKASGPAVQLHQPLCSLGLRYNPLNGQDSNWDEGIIMLTPRRIRLFLATYLQFMDDVSDSAYVDKLEAAVDVFRKLDWMVDEREWALDTGREVLQVEVRPDSSARTRIMPVEGKRKRKVKRSLPSDKQEPETAGGLGDRMLVGVQWVDAIQRRGREKRSPKGQVGKREDEDEDVFHSAEESL